MTPIDLTPAHRRHARDARIKRQRWTTAVTIYAGLIACGWLWTGGQSDELHAAETTVREQTEQRDLAAQRLKDAQHQAHAAARTVEAVRMVRSYPDWSPVLWEIARRRGKDIILDRCEIKPVTLGEAASIPALAKVARAAGKPPAGAQPIVGYRVVIGGVGPTPAAVADYVLSLQQWGVFDGVSQTEIRGRTVRSVEAIAFRVECVLAEQPSASETMPPDPAKP